jgi:hypothetical protein
MRIQTILLGSLVLCQCGAPPVATQTPAPAPAPTSALTTSPASPPSSATADDANARVAALIEDMQRREAAAAERDRADQVERERRSKEIPVVYETASRPAARPVTSTTGSAPSTTVDSTPHAEAGDKDEAWWKRQMREVQVRLANNVERLESAREQARMASEQMRILAKGSPPAFAAAQEAAYAASADVRRYEAEVLNDRAAVERLREDARRANVPPGWLRWP